MAKKRNLDELPPVERGKILQKRERDRLYKQKIQTPELRAKSNKRSAEWRAINLAEARAYDRVTYARNLNGRATKTRAAAAAKRALETPEQRKVRNAYVRQWRANRRAQDPTFGLKDAIRTRISHALSGKRKLFSTIEGLGCTTEELARHLEGQFEPGMTWKNRGIKSVPLGERYWEVDHVLPVASFDLTDPQQYLVAFNFKNLQPLWREDNIRKGDKIVINGVTVLGRHKINPIACDNDV